MAATRFTRRDMLAAVLGAPLAAAACRRGTGRATIPAGEIVGASADFGHRIRDGIAERVPDRRMRARVLVVGAGIAGLSCAWKMTRAGLHDFLVVELERSPGGTSMSGRNHVSPYPWGAHYIPVPLANNHHLVGLLDEMDLLEGIGDDGSPIVREQYLCHAPQERVYYRGRWWEGIYLHAGESEEDLRQLAGFIRVVDEWVAFRDDDGRRAFVIPRAHGSDDERVRALDAISMGELMRSHGFDSPRLLWYVDYACRDDYGLRMDETSAWAGLFYFASRVETSGDEAEPLMAWPEGNGRFVRHFADVAGHRLATGLGAFRIEERDGAAVTTCVTADGREVVAIESDRVVFAAPQFMRPWVIGGEQPAGLREFEYGAWLVANLTLDERTVDRGFPLCWDNVLYESPALGYVCATHQRGLNLGPTVLTWYFALCQSDSASERQRLLALGRDEWADVALADLERAHPEIRRACSRLDIARWGHAMVSARPGFMWSPALAQAARPAGRIHFAHSDLSGLALFEEAFHHGLRAADEVLAIVQA
jgi:glycine/D-amino acid oxidase-like deaminating enzyme